MMPRFLPAMVIFCVSLPLAHAAAAQTQPSPPPPSAAQGDTEKFVAEMQKVYEATGGMHAGFTQKVKSGMGRVQEAAGQVWFKKPGKMRFEYSSPHKKQFIADGRTMWIYDPDRKEVQTLPFKTSLMPAALAFLWGEGKLAESFAITRAEKQRIPIAGNVELKLVPRDANRFVKELYFSVDPKTYRVTGTVIYDHTGTVNMILFSNVDAQTPSNNGMFTFVKPAGVAELRFAGSSGDDAPASGSVKSNP